MKKLLLAGVAGVLAATAASASPFTTTSPTGGALPAGVTEIGGIVLDLTGANGTRVVSQLAASSLYVGYAYTSQFTIGTQSGFDAATVAALGGGLSAASIRFTLYDGDSAPGNFDYNHNTLQLNNVQFGNWSDVATQYTNSDGTVVNSSGFGFGDNLLSTGFFSSTDATTLAAFYGTLATGSVAYQLTDTNPGDNYYDFTQGVDGGLINVGQGPTVASVPEPASWAMMIGGFGMIGGTLRRRKVSTAVSFG